MVIQKLTFFSVVFCMLHLNLTASQQQNGNYYSLIREIQQWHETNPNSCGHDTPSCGAQKLVDGFQSCGDVRIGKNGFRIVNGCTAEVPHVGWTVGALTGPQLCTGTLVSPRHIVLAAHCIDGVTSRATLYIGNRSLKNASLSTDQKYYSQSYAMHPAYNRLAAANDSGIIKLDRDVSFTTTGTRPACLPTSQAPRTLTNCLAAGYGVNDNDKDSKDDGAGRLRYTVLSTVKDSRCYRAYGDGKYGYHPSLSFCAVGKHNNNGSDTCTGDSGAGFVCKDGGGRWTLQGIVRTKSRFEKNGAKDSNSCIQVRSIDTPSYPSVTCVYGPPQCGSVPSVYADAFALGIQNPTNIQRRDTGDICKGESSSSSDTNTGGGFGSGSTPFMPPKSPSFPSPPPSSSGSSSFDQIFGPPQFSGFGSGNGIRDAKKAGGLSGTIASTIKDAGCSSGAECVSNTCRPVSLCSSQAAVGTKFRIVTPNILPDGDFNPMPRPTKVVKVDEERQAKFTPRMCRTANLCWPSVWQNAFSSAVPMFEFSS